MKSGIIIQARMSSSRFPGKMLEKIGNYSLVEFVYRRCLESRIADTVAVITSTVSSDDQLYNYCSEKGINVFRGDLSNVLARYIAAADFFQLDVVSRVCGDSPFVDIEKVDEMLLMMKDKKLDYVNFNKESVVWGLDSEVVKTELLKKIEQENLMDEDKEHVTLYIKKTIQNYKAAQINFHHSKELVNKVRLTVDEPNDIIFCRKIFEHIKGLGFKFKSQDIDLAISKELQKCVE